MKTFIEIFQKCFAAQTFTLSYPSIDIYRRQPLKIQKIIGTKVPKRKKKQNKKKKGKWQILFQRS